MMWQALQAELGPIMARMGPICRESVRATFHHLASHMAPNFHKRVNY